MAAVSCISFVHNLPEKLHDPAASDVLHWVPQEEAQVGQPVKEKAEDV